MYFLSFIVEKQAMISLYLLLWFCSQSSSVNGIFEQQRKPSIVILLEENNMDIAQDIALKFQMIVKGQPFLKSHFFLDVVNDSITYEELKDLMKSLKNEPQVKEVFFQYPKMLFKRNTLPSSREKPYAVPLFEQQSKSSKFKPFPDPWFQEQWYLLGKAQGNYDMGMREAWALGYTGQNVIVSILDDGIQFNHPDLAKNYDSKASTDIIDHDDIPLPKKDSEHGTNCAGIVASVAGNNYCGVGIAYNSKIGGIRMLDNAISDNEEAAAINFNYNYIDIYSASWGAKDDGKTIGGPGHLTSIALTFGAKHGRQGKGNIFVWSSGNGGMNGDSCSADGYVNSIYTIPVASVTYDNKSPYYGEECPGILTSTYSSSYKNDPAIVTTTSTDCTKNFSGTSASAPLTTGIIALMLEANPLLTWRDVQHIIVKTSDSLPLLHNNGWGINGAGLKVSSKFGFGIINAYKAVKLSKTWKPVPTQHLCTINYKPSSQIISNDFIKNYTITFTGCDQPINYLEHVQVVASIRSSTRGDLRLTLYSPMGTKVTLLPFRPKDVSKIALNKWPFLSVHSWGENPIGKWTLTVEFRAKDNYAIGAFYEWDLKLYGTETPP